MIKIQDLCFSYRASNGNVEVLQDINLSVGAGEFLSIIGPSGCGKTSLLRLIAGLEAANSGEINVEATRSAFVFQTPALFPWMTVRGNVEKPLKLQNVDKQEIKSRVDAVLNLVDLEDFVSKYPHQLSGGMQQRAAIARALVIEPDLLLMDEPFGALDELTREKMNLELHELWKRTGTTVCFVTHSISEAAFLSTQTLVLSGRPGAVKQQVKSDLGLHRSLETFVSPEFNAQVAEIRSAMRAD